MNKRPDRAGFDGKGRQSGLKQDMRMQSVTARASLSSRQEPAEQDSVVQWGFEQVFHQSEESTETSEEIIDIPLGPENRSRDTIRETFNNISTYSPPEVERIYRQAKDFYVEDAEKIRDLDVVDLAQTVEFAHDKNQDGWIEPLSNRIEEYFEGLEENPMFLRQDLRAGEEGMGLDEIRAAVEERRQSLREATEEVYGSPDEEPNNSLIEEAQQVYLWGLLNKRGISNLLPQ